MRYQAWGYIAAGWLAVGDITTITEARLIRDALVKLGVSADVREVQA